MLTDKSMLDQLTTYLGECADEYDTDSIIREFIGRYGRVDLDTIPICSYWGVIDQHDLSERSVMRDYTRRLAAEARRIHDDEGHPEGYEGPCWGPTLANIEQAKVNLAAQPDHHEEKGDRSAED